MSEDRNARDLGDLVVAYTDYNCKRWSKELPAAQQHVIVSYFSNLQYLSRNNAAIEREPAKLEAFKKSLSATVNHQVHEADPPRAEVSSMIGCMGLLSGIAGAAAAVYNYTHYNAFALDYTIGGAVSVLLGAYLSRRAYKASQVKQYAYNYRALHNAAPQLWTDAFTHKSPQISEALGRFTELNIALRTQGSRPAV